MNGGKHERNHYNDKSAEIIKEIKIGKAIDAPGAYQSEDKHIDAMIAITERNMGTEPEFP